MTSRCDEADECRFDPRCPFYSDNCRHDDDSSRDDPLAPPAGYVHDPESKPLEDTGCDVHEQATLLLPDAKRCAKPGVARIWFGCPREHMGFADLCSRHRLPVLAGFPARCDNCARAGEPSQSKIIRQDETKGN